VSNPLSNAEIASRLERHGRLLEISGESPFRTRAYARVAETLRTYPERLSDVAREGRLRAIPGVGEGIAASIEQLIATGRFAAHDDLVRQVPESLLELTGVPGVGPKTALRLHSELGVVDLPSLEAALVAGQIAATKGLGRRIEATIRSGLESIQRRSGRIPLGVALPIARAAMGAFERASPADTIHLAGSARRWEETVGDLDFVVASADPESSFTRLASLPMVAGASRTGAHAARLALAGDIDADVFFADVASLGSTLLRATGNAEHLARLGKIGDAATEEEIYATRGLPWIPPELRSGGEEFERWSEIQSLVRDGDINGEFHAHTKWSDGSATIAAMADAAIDRGYTFLGITDHSHGLGVAGGLDVQRLTAQRVEIEAVQAEEHRSIRLLAGAEVEVHRDGRLDYDDETLARLDVVVASLHSGLRQPREELTARLERVLRNPNVDIIAHPSGRLIERREGGDFDWNRVYATAARTGTALEINADPARLDLNAEHAARARAAGCLIAINCDAHHPSGFSLIEYGVAVARKAWLQPRHILNCWSRDDVLSWLADRTPS
jgi:DNA polymerase (family X)